MNSHEDKTQHGEMIKSKDTQGAQRSIVRRLNSQLQEEEVLLFGLEDVDQLEDVGVLHPE